MNFIKKILNKNIYLSLLSGILFSLSWPPNGIFIFIMLAFVPLFTIESKLNNHKYKKIKVFLYSLISFFIWNIFALYWIAYSTFVGMIMTIILSSLFMSLVFILYSIVKTKLGYRIGTLFFIFFWLSLEVFMHSDNIAFPWLNLGNVFSNNVELIQWYEYTGVFGGTLWICIVNILVFKLSVNIRINELMEKGASKIIKSSLYLVAMLITPMFISKMIYLNYVHKGDYINVLVHQSNLDPYTEKFRVDNEQQSKLMLENLSDRLDKDLDYVIFPETYLHRLIELNTIDEYNYIKMIKGLTNRFPKLNIILGSSLYQESNLDNAYKYYNSAIQINKEDKTMVYHKSKLVPGVEKVPFSNVIKPILGELLFKLGGANNSYSEDSTRVVFSNYVNDFRAGVIICYESTFGAHVSEYVRNGANVLFIITNDGWWSNSKGREQHLEYAKLRSIENRRSIARSANTGISAFINQKGEILKELEYNQDNWIRHKIKANNSMTFYSRNPHIIAIISIIGVIVIFLYYIRRVRSS